MSNDIFVGTTALDDLKSGTDQVEAVYSGTDLVWRYSTHIMTVGTDGSSGGGFYDFSSIGSMAPTAVVVGGVSQTWLRLQFVSILDKILIDWSSSDAGDSWTSCVLTTSTGTRTTILKSACTYSSGRWNTATATYTLATIGTVGTDTKIVFT